VLVVVFTLSSAPFDDATVCGSDVPHPAMTKAHEQIPMTVLRRTHTL
jgi:hypothetical protein